MPSDERTTMALEALSAAGEVFRSAVAAAANEVGARLAAHREPRDGRVSRTAAELGSFAAGRLDPERFAGLVTREGELGFLAAVRMERAFDTLSEIARRGSDVFHVSVPPGGDLRASVAAALAEAGRAFAASRVAELARVGSPAEAEIDLHAGFPVRLWNRAERQLVPPLVVEVDGGDAQAGGLAEFMNGTQKIVLVIRGPAPPAPLVRLITPGVLVVQADDISAVAAVAEAKVPAIAALVGPDAARFTHAPGGGNVWQRLSVTHLPEQELRGRIGSFTSHQQVHELAWLRQLATAPEPVALVAERVDAPVAATDPEREARRPDVAPAGATSRPEPPSTGAPGAGAEAAIAAPAADPVDRLAAWLLSEAELTGTG